MEFTENDLLEYLGKLTIAEIEVNFPFLFKATKIISSKVTP